MLSYYFYCNYWKNNFLRIDCREDYPTKSNR